MVQQDDQPGGPISDVNTVSRRRDAIARLEGVVEEGLLRGGWIGDIHHVQTALYASCTGLDHFKAAAGVPFGDA